MAQPELEAQEQINYYELLGTDNTADIDAIKKAYKRTALRFHPDKIGGTPESVEHFQQIQTAYHVLSDPKKRRIYDEFGTSGISMLEKMGGLSDFIDPQAVLTINTFLCLSTLIVVFLIIFASFVASKADALVGWSWTITFIPIFLADAIVIHLILIQPAQEDSANAGLKYFALFYFFFIMLFDVFLALKLDGITLFSWWAVFSPILALEVINIGWIVYACIGRLSETVFVPLFDDWEGQQHERPLFVKEKFVIVLGMSMPLLCRVSQMILIILKLEATLDVSWQLVLLPTVIQVNKWLYGFVLLLRIASSFFQTRRTLQKQNPEESAKFVSLIIGFFVFVLFVYSTAGLLANRLSNPLYNSPTAAVILVPVFIILSILFCCVCCCLPLVVMQTRMAVSMELAGNRKTMIPIERRIANRTIIYIPQ